MYTLQKENLYKKKIKKDKKKKKLQEGLFQQIVLQYYRLQESLMCYGLSFGKFYFVNYLINKITLTLKIKKKFERRQNEEILHR